MDALIKCTLWNQPAGVVEACNRGETISGVTPARFKLRRWIKLDAEPRVGASLVVPGWDCGTIESVLWDEKRRAYAINVSDIFVEDGPDDQRETDFWVLRNAAVMCDWEAGERTLLSTARREATMAMPEAKRGLFGFGKSSVTKGLRQAA